MSIQNTIRYNQTKHFLKQVDKLKVKGEEFIRAASKSLNQLCPDNVKELSSTGTRLHLSFFGLALLVRVEVEIDQDEPGRIRTYLTDNAAPPRLQPLGIEYAFDDLGNVNRLKTIEEAAAWFGSDLIEHLRSKKIALLL